MYNALIPQYLSMKTRRRVSSSDRENFSKIIGQRVITTKELHYASKWRAYTFDFRETLIYTRAA